MMSTTEKPQFQVLPSVDQNGGAIFSVVVKRTYDIRDGQPLVRAEQDQPLIATDQYYDGGNPTETTVQFESDLVPCKHVTDVVVIGRAYTPGYRPAQQCDVAVQVGSFRKVLRVIGDRRCFYAPGKDPVFSEPEPFTEMPMRYERSYGGTDSNSLPDMPFPYPRNPMGKGIAILNTMEAIEGLGLPNIEDPHELLTPDRVVLGDIGRWNQQPLAHGLGWVQKTWYPRCSFVGAMPGNVAPQEAMREEGLGLVPAKQVALTRQFKLPRFDTRFNSGASLGLAFPFLAGDQSISLTNLSANGQLRFSLPNHPPKIMMDISFGEKSLHPVLQTVSIRPDDHQVDLVWRGVHEYPGTDWLNKMNRFHVQIT